MLFCFTNISAEILLHVLHYSFCTERHVLGTFGPNAAAIKSAKNYLRKTLPLYRLMKLTPVGNFTNIL